MHLLGGVSEVGVGGRSDGAVVVEGRLVALPKRTINTFGAALLLIIRHFIGHCASVYTAL